MQICYYTPQPSPVAFLNDYDSTRKNEDRKSRKHSYRLTEFSQRSNYNSSPSVPPSMRGMMVVGSETLPSSSSSTSEQSIEFSHRRASTLSRPEITTRNWRDESTGRAARRQTVRAR